MSFEFKFALEGTGGSKLDAPLLRCLLVTSCFTFLRTETPAEA